jgi:hypothetical protein
METIWKNTRDRRTIFKMDLKGVGIEVMSYLRIETTAKPLLTWY